MKTPIITIVGRPNVGKSTLFNRIIGSRVAITAEEAGTTRDRLFHKVVHPVIDFYLVDTGGLEFGKSLGAIEGDMQTQSRIAMEEGDLILFVVDSKEGTLSQDFLAAELLRSRVKKPVFLVVNKCDEFLDEAELAEFYSLGLGQPYQISATHKLGIDMLVDQIVLSLKERHFITKKDKAYAKALSLEGGHIQIAVVGKPNVGKSSLINAILNKEKLIVSEIPGTTRDSTDSLIKHKNKEYNFIDTAGLKRPGKTDRGIEKFSALRSMSSIERCDIALLVLDTSLPISHQDQAIASYITEAGKGLIVLANKWDIKLEDSPTTEEERRNIYISRLKRRFPFLSWAPVVFTSAITKKNLPTVFEQIELINQERKKRITTAQLNAFLQQLIHDHAPTGKGRVRPKIFYITQPETEPPLFIVFVNKESAFHFSYIRYMENRIREKFGFTGTAIRIEYRERTRRDMSV